MHNSFSDQTNSPAGYAGKILSGDFSGQLKQRVKDEISACHGFDQIGLSIIPYIAAWHIDYPGIWYEFISHRFLELFDVPPEKLSQVFGDAILDRREYKQADLYPAVKEMNLPRNELDDQRQRIREQSIQTGETEAVYKVQLPDNGIRWLKDWAHVNTFADDGICLSPGFLADVTMEMLKKDHVDETNVMVNRDKGLLVEAERHAALGQISAQVFHEIRNPILSIGGLAKRLSVHLPDNADRKYMDVIVNETKRLENILSNLFTLTSPVVLKQQATDLVQMIKSVISLLRSDFEQNAIKVSFHPDIRIPDLFIDQELTHEALVHIIKNSIDAMPDGGTLFIDIRELDGFALVMIQDSGKGIPAAHERRATEPFFTTKVYGSGLGLSLAKKTAEMHGGKIIVKQLETGGTEVCIFLPLEKGCGN